MPADQACSLLERGADFPGREDAVVRNVVIVDDAEIGRLGWVNAVQKAGHDARAELWSEAAAALEGGRVVDLMVLVLRRDPYCWDRYHAIGHGDQLRHVVGPACRIVAVLDPREMANAMVGLRLDRLGVDEMVPAHQVDTRVAVARLVEGTLTGIDPRPDPIELAVRGVGRRSEPNQVMAHLLALPNESEHRRAFDPEVRQNQCDLSRRQALNLRRKVCDLGDLSPGRTTSGGGPPRDLSLARWSAMVAFVNECRGWEPADDHPRVVSLRGEAWSAEAPFDLGVAR